MLLNKFTINPFCKKGSIVFNMLKKKSSKNKLYEKIKSISISKKILICKTNTLWIKKLKIYQLALLKPGKFPL